jgi:hypothetical protein
VGELPLPLSQLLLEQGTPISAQLYENQFDVMICAAAILLLLVQMQVIMLLNQ